MVEISEMVAGVSASLAQGIAASGDLSSLTDIELVAAQRPLGELRRQIGALTAMLSGEVARRSARELGHSGLAQRSGFANAESLLQSGLGLTRIDATKLVRVGTELSRRAPTGSLLGGETDAPPSLAEQTDWRARVAWGVTHGALSVEAAQSILRGLDGIDDRIPAAVLCAAAERLMAEHVDPDRLFQLARQRRDELDLNGTAEREAARRERRSFFLRVQPDGMYRGSIVLDPEDGQLISSAIDSVLSPRRGGPRFVDPTAARAAEALMNDPRTNEQIAADALVDLVRLAVDADPTRMAASRRPAVRVIVQERALNEHHGQGYLEANVDAVSIETVERHLCNTGVIGVKFDDSGECVNVGREQRLFTSRQRVGLAVRDGGCRFPNCERPPAHCEAHHIEQWQRDEGKTDLADGVLLCRRHHMLLHNNHWQITRRGALYWLVPPPTIDREQKPIPLPGQAAPIVPHVSPARGVTRPQSYSPGTSRRVAAITDRVNSSTSTSTATTTRAHPIG